MLCPLLNYNTTTLTLAICFLLIDNTTTLTLTICSLLIDKITNWRWWSVPCWLTSQQNWRRRFVCCWTTTQYEHYGSVTLLLWTLENHRKMWEAWGVPSKMPLENLEEQLPDKISNKQLYEKTATIPLSRTNKGMRWKWIGLVSKGITDRISELSWFGLSYCVENARTPKEHLKACSEKKKEKLEWHCNVWEGHRLLEATVVSGVFSCKASCVILGTKRISK